MTRARIERLRIRVRAPLDASGARALASAIARELPSAIARELPSAIGANGTSEVARVAVPAIRASAGELAPAGQPALAGRVAQAVGRALGDKERR